jgi:hypothetical protein
MTQIPPQSPPVDYTNTNPCFDIEESGLEHGLVYSDNGISIVSGDAYLRDSIKSIELETAWRPSMLTAYPIDGFSGCDMATDVPTQFRQLLWNMLKSSFFPILCKYKDNPDDFAYAVTIFNAIADHFCSASKLELSPVNYHRTPNGFVDIVENHYERPIPGELPFPLERVQVSRVPLNRVEPKNLMSDEEIKETDAIIRNGHRLKNSHTSDNLEATYPIYVDYATQWSTHLYDNQIMQGPMRPTSVDGDLAYELEWSLPPVFSRQSSIALFNTLVPYLDFGVNPPERAKDILQDFRDELTNVLTYLEQATVPLDYQLFGVESNLTRNAGTYSMTQIDQAIDHSLLETNHSGTTAKKYGLDYFKDLDDLRNTLDGENIASEYKSSKAVDTLVDDFKAGFEDIKATMSAKGSAIPLNPKITNFDALARKVYDPWCRAILQAILHNRPVTAAFADIHSLLSGTELLPDNEYYNDVPVPEIKVYSRQVYALILDKISSILNNNKSSFLNEAALTLASSPNGVGMYEVAVADYDNITWYLNTTNLLYNNYIKDINKDRQHDYTDYAHLSQEAPFITYTISSGHALMDVLDTSSEILALSSNSSLLGIRAWPEYEDLNKSCFSEDPELLFANVARGFFEMNIQADDFYDDIGDTVNEENISTLRNILACLLKDYQAVEDTVLENLSPELSKRFINRLRYAINLLKFYSKQYEAYETRGTTELTDLVNDDLSAFISDLPFGWPAESGTTMDGITLNYSFDPNPRYYLSQDDFYLIFQPDSPYTAKQASGMLKQFFTNYRKGYASFFLFGGYESNSKGVQVAYDRKLEILNKLLLTLEDIYLAGDLHKEEMAGEFGDNYQYCDNIYRLAKDTFHQVTRFMGSKHINDPHWGLMEARVSDVTEFTGIVPSYVDHRHDPGIDFKNAEEAIMLDVNSHIWQGEQQPWVYLDNYISNYNVASFVANKNKSNDAVSHIITYETALAELPKPSEFDFLEWYLHNANAPELQYLIGQLLTIVAEASDFKETNSYSLDDEEDINLKYRALTDAQKQRYHAVVGIIERTPKDLLTDISETFSQIDFLDQVISMPLPESALLLFAEMPSHESIWVAGYLGNRLAASKRYSVNKDWKQITYEGFRQDHIDRYLFERDVTSADEDVAWASNLLEELARNYDLELGDINNDDKSAQVISQTNDYYNSEIAAGRRSAKELYLKLNDNKSDGSFTPEEVLYFTSLLSSELYGTPDLVSLKSLEDTFEYEYPDFFDTDKVRMFLETVPDQEKPYLYAYAYRLSQSHYEQTARIYFKHSSQDSTALFYTDPTLQQPTEFWEVMSEFANQPDYANLAQDHNISNTFRVDDFEPDEIEEIRAAWNYNGIRPRMPNNSRFVSVDCAQHLNEQLDNRNFFERNEQVFTEALLINNPDLALSMPDLWAALYNMNNLPPEDVIQMNAILLASINPYLSVKIQNRQRLVNKIDKALDQYKPDLDLPAEMALTSMLDGIVASYERFDSDGGLFQHKPELFTEIKDILFGEHDLSSSVERSLYSRYNPNGHYGNYGTPPELSMIYSKTFFSAKTRVEDPRLLRRIKPMLTDMYKIFDEEMNEEQISTLIQTDWNDLEAMELINAEYNNIFTKYTVAYYYSHDADKVEQVQTSLNIINRELTNKIYQLKHNNEVVQNGPNQ